MLGASWFASRLNYGGVLERTLRKVFPDYWSFLLGEVAALAFVYLLMTGLFIGCHYEPGIAAVRYEGAFAALRGADLPRSFATTLVLSYDVPLGLLSRRMHHFAAHVFLASIVLHAARIFFGGAFRRPREFNWVLGTVLLLLAVFAGFTGYSLPYDQRGGTALRMAYTQAVTLPWIGHWLAPFVFGPVFPSDLILARIYLAHVFVLPGTLLLLVSAHVALVVLQSHTQKSVARPAARYVVGSPLWPEQTVRTLAVALVTLALIALLAAFFPVDSLSRDGPYSMVQQRGALEPDWFLFFSEGAYRLLPAIEWRALGTTFTGPFLGGVLLIAVVFVLLAVYPWVDRRVYRWGNADTHDVEPASSRPFRAAAGVAGAVFLTLLSFGVANERLAGLVQEVYRVNRWLLAIVVMGTPASACAVFAGLRRRRRRGSAGR